MWQVTIFHIGVKIIEKIIPIFQFLFYFIAAAATDLSVTNVSINKLQHFAVLPIYPDMSLVSGLFSSFLCDDMVD